MSAAAPDVRDRASALVLAGGRSRRFGSDKLAAELGGRPLLEHALMAASVVCAQVLVLRPPGATDPSLPAELAARVEVVADERAFEGPLVALSRAAARARGERLLLVGGDMPWLVSGLLARLLAFAPRRDGACLLVDGERAPLPLAIGREALLRDGPLLVAEGERSLRSLLRRADLEPVPEREWRQLDPDGRSLRDVDRPEDLGADSGGQSATPSR